MLWRTGKKDRQEGQALIETAIMIPVMLLLLMGIIEFGFIFYANVRVANATREGARAGSLWLMNRKPGDSYDQLRQTAVDAVEAELGILPDIIYVEPQDPAYFEPGEPITVTVTYNYTLPIVSALPLIRDVIPSPLPIFRRVVMRFQ